MTEETRALIGDREVVRGEESVFVACTYVKDAHEEFMNVRFSVVDAEGNETCEIRGNLNVDRQSRTFSSVTFEGSPERML